MENNKDNNKHLYISRDGHSYKTLEDYLEAEEKYERQRLHSFKNPVDSLPHNDGFPRDVLNSSKKKR